MATANSIKNKILLQEGRIKEIGNELERLASVTSGDMVLLEESTRVLQFELKCHNAELENLNGEYSKAVEYESSKEYKEKIKERERLEKETLQRAKEFYKELERLEKFASETMEMNKQHDRLARETGIYQGNRNLVKPFTWLEIVRIGIKRGIENTALMQRFFQ